VDSAPPSLWSLNPRGVVRVGSFAKSVAPGLRLGYLTAWPEFVARIADRGHVDSGGGLNHATAMTMAEFGRSGAFEAHLRRILPVYRRKRDILVDAMARHVPAAELAVPDGGWFLWARLPVDGDALLPVAERHGVSFVPGARFCVPPAAGAPFIRLSYSMLEFSLLEEGARRLGTAVRALGFG
jgi:DNA-binding transcriptional MocR family regulator